MRRFIYAVLVSALITSAGLVIADGPKKPSEIDCTCGCGMKAVKCGDHCSAAKGLLKKYKGA